MIAQYVYLNSKMDDRDIHDKTRALLKQLNYFVAHIIVYFFVNLGLVYLIFNFDGLRWLVFIIVGWALGVIYHGFRISGIDFLSSKDKSSKLLWSWVFKLVGT